MISLEKWCNYILIFGLIMLVPSIVYVKFADELCALALMTGVALDCILNGNWRRYNLLWLFIALMTFYAVYSLTVVHFNVPVAILFDWVIELKPYVPFLVFFCVKPDFTRKQKQVISVVSIANSIICVIALESGSYIRRLVIQHPAFGGGIIFVSCMFLIYCNLDKNGQLPRRMLQIVVLLLTLGLLCGRSKYYGLYVFALFFLFIYKPGMMSRFNLKHVLLVTVTLALVVIVAWKKIEYYFLSGGAESFDPSMVESYARPVMYATAGLVVVDFFPFGSGLASLGTYASGQWYSGLYYEYGINSVFGLTPKDPAFICDAFYASLGQFGIVGIILFVWFWVYAYSFLRALIRQDNQCYKYPFIIGSLIILFVLIESIAGTAITQSEGMMPLCLLGLIAGHARRFKAEQKAEKRALRTERRQPTFAIRKI